MTTEVRARAELEHTFAAQQTALRGQVLGESRKINKKYLHIIQKIEIIYRN
jgi:hypothetical protein